MVNKRKYPIFIASECHNINRWQFLQHLFYVDRIMYNLLTYFCAGEEERWLKQEPMFRFGQDLNGYTEKIYSLLSSTMTAPEIATIQPDIFPKKNFLKKYEEIWR